MLNFCTNYQKPSQGSSSACSSSSSGSYLTAVRRRNRLEWTNGHIRWRLALWRGVFFTDEYRFSLYRADARQRVWRRVVSGLLMSTLWIEWPMVKVGLWYGQAYVLGQRTQVHFIDGILNAQRYRDEILRPIVEPFIHGHHLMLQGSVHNSWKLKTSQFLNGQHSHQTCHPLSMFGMLWIGIYDSVCSSSCQYSATSHSH